MFCKNCGKAIEDGTGYCPHCGGAQGAARVTTEKLPVNGLGIAGFVISLLSLYLGAFYCVASIVGLVLSAIAYSKRDKCSLNGLALAGLIIGIVSLVLWGIIWLTVGSMVIAML